MNGGNGDATRRGRRERRAPSRHADSVNVDAAINYDRARRAAAVRAERDVAAQARRATVSKVAARLKASSAPSTPVRVVQDMTEMRTILKRKVEDAELNAIDPAVLNMDTFDLEQAAQRQAAAENPGPGTPAANADTDAEDNDDEVR